jgi:hypothetical protein
MRSLDKAVIGRMSEDREDPTSVNRADQTLAHQEDPMSVNRAGPMLASLAGRTLVAQANPVANLSRTFRIAFPIAVNGKIGARRIAMK